MSKPLDGLREKVRRVMDDWILSGGISTGEMYAAFDQFEKSHPGLVDLTDGPAQVIASKGRDGSWRVEDVRDAILRQRRGGRA